MVQNWERFSLKRLRSMLDGANRWFGRQVFFGLRKLPARVRPLKNAEVSLGGVPLGVVSAVKVDTRPRIVQRLAELAAARLPDVDAGDDGGYFGPPETMRFAKEAS